MVKQENPLESRIRKIISSKGYRMSDIASKMGVSQSNLMTSIRKNPKLSTMVELVEAMGCSLSDLLQPSISAPTSGLAMIDGVTYEIKQAPPAIPQLPIYRDSLSLRSVVDAFVRESIATGDNVMSGMFLCKEYFTLLFDEKSARFHLVLYYADAQKLCLDYSVEDYKKDNSVFVEDLINLIQQDLEEAVVVKLADISEDIVPSFVGKVMKTFRETPVQGEDSQEAKERLINIAIDKFEDLKLDEDQKADALSKLSFIYNRKYK